jgi:hypothetical protein
MTRRYRIPRSDVITASIPKASRPLATASAITAAAFVAILVVLHLIEPEFDPSWRFISEYQLGAWGWLMSVAFLCLAASAATLLFAVRTQIRTVGGRTGLGLLGLCALAFVVAAAFRTDPLLAETGSVPGLIHNTAAALGGFVPLAAYLIAWSLARNITWRPYRRTLWWVTLPAIIGNVAAFAQNAIIASAGAEFGPATAIGWPNRVLIVGFAVWMLGAALLVRTVAEVSPEPTTDAGDQTTSGLSVDA